MATDRQQRLSAAERSNLVAYLDGELTEVEREQLESKLIASVSGRHEADALRKTWDMLDYLPRPSPGPDFTARTVSMLATEALPDERLASLAGQTFRSVGQVLALLCLLGTVGAASYAAIRWLWPDPTSRLTRDLTLAERLDEYRDLGTFEYLEQLEALPQFHQAGAPSNP